MVWLGGLRRAGGTAAKVDKLWVECTVVCLLSHILLRHVSWEEKALTRWALNSQEHPNKEAADRSYHRASESRQQTTAVNQLFWLNWLFLRLFQIEQKIFWSSYGHKCWVKPEALPQAHQGECSGRPGVFNVSLLVVKLLIWQQPSNNFTLKSQTEEAQVHMIIVAHADLKAGQLYCPSWRVCVWGMDRSLVVRHLYCDFNMGKVLDS